MKLRRLKLLFFVFLISAMLIVPVVAAPRGGGATYTVYGYVKEIDTGNKIPGASVILYKMDEVGRIKVASQLTNSDGRFSFSTYQSSMPLAWEVMVSKTGYESATKRVACRSTTTNMGTIYLTPAVPPPTPEITVISADWRNSEFTLHWYVNWGTPLGGTTYSMDLYWGEDSDFTGETAIQSWSGTSNPFKTVTIECSHRGEWWYQIVARAVNSYGDRNDIVNEPTMGIILPLADAYTYAGEPWDNYGAATFLRAGTPYPLPDARAYLKFSIPNPQDVTSVSLLAYRMNYGTHSGVTAYSVDTSWDESEICWNIQPDYDPWNDLVDIDAYGECGKWDSWDVTEIAKNPMGFSIVLVYKGDPFNLLDVLNYASKEGPIDACPHLLVQYRIDSQEIPYDTLGVPQDVAITDDFEDESMSLDIWDAQQIGPDNEYIFATGAVQIGAPNIPSGIGPTGWTFSQDGLRYPEGFHFQTKLEIINMVHLFAPDFVTLGIELYSDDYYQSSIPFCYFVVQYRKAGGDFWLMGNIFGMQDEVQLDSLFEFIGVELIVHRDPVTGDIRLLYNSNYNSEIQEFIWREARFEVNSVVLRAEFAGIPEFQQTHSGFDWFREFPVQLARNPFTPGYNFEEPLLEPDFENKANVLNYWNLSMTNGDVSTDEARHNENSWYVSTTEALHSWKMGQSFASENIDVLKNQIVGFSLFAHAASTTSMMRVEIGYEVNSEWFEACGEWQVLNEGDDSWIELSACTRYPLPETLTQLEVRIVGLGYKDELFSAYIDFAQLKLVASSYSESYFGSTILSSSIFYSDTNPNDNIDFGSQPLVGVWAKDGWYIKNVRMNIDIIPPITGTNYASISSSHLIEGNNEGLSYQTPEEYEEWLHQVTLFRQIVKWSIRVGSFILGDYFGGAGPVGWGISEIADTGFQILLLTNRDPDDGSTLGDGHAHEDVNYQPEFIIYPHISMLGCDFEWKVHNSGHSRPPLLRVTFVVDWCSLFGQVMGTTAVGMCLVVSL